MRARAGALRQTLSTAASHRSTVARQARTAPPQRSASIRAQLGEPFAEGVKRLGVKFVLFSWTDLFGVMRSKMVPAAAAADVAAAGAGFAGFAAHLDLLPSHPDVLATPDASSLVVLPWKREVAWVACDLTMGGKPLDQRCVRGAAHLTQKPDKLGESVHAFPWPPC